MWVTGFGMNTQCASEPGDRGYRQQEDPTARLAAKEDREPMEPYECDELCWYRGEVQDHRTSLLEGARYERPVHEALFFKVLERKVCKRCWQRGLQRRAEAHQKEKYVNLGDDDDFKDEGTRFVSSAYRPAVVDFEEQWSRKEGLSEGGGDPLNEYLRRRETVTARVRSLTECKSR